MERIFKAVISKQCKNSRHYEENNHDQQNDCSSAAANASTTRICSRGLNNDRWRSWFFLRHRDHHCRRLIYVDCHRLVGDFGLLITVNNCLFLWLCPSLNFICRWIRGRSLIRKSGWRFFPSVGRCIFKLERYCVDIWHRYRRGTLNFMCLTLIPGGRR